MLIQDPRFVDINSETIIGRVSNNVAWASPVFLQAFRNRKGRDLSQEGKKAALRLPDVGTQFRVSKELLAENCQK